MNKEISKKFSVGIGLAMFLLLLPLENVCADGRDHSFEKLATISAILMVTVASIIFTSVFARNKELLIKVMVFCVLLVLILFLGVYSIFALAAIIMYVHIRFPSLSLQEKKRIRKFIFIFIFLLIIASLSIIQNSIIN